MKVDFDLFLKWATDYFGEYNIKLKNTAHGVEICTNSIFSEDKIGKTDVKYHMWMNPNGGKKSKNPDIGSYRCWLTDEMGSLVGLVCKLEHIDWEEAQQKICGGSSLRDLEKKVNEFFASQNNWSELPAISTKRINKVELPKDCFLIDNLSDTHFLKIKALKYLDQRKIPSTDLYICCSGEYKDRILIPYFNKEREIIFFNTRLIYDKEHVLRYVKCKEIDQNSVVFLTDWNIENKKVYVMEGEFDALTMRVCGLIGCACGKFMSENQAEILRRSKIVLSFDTDGAGKKALVTIGDFLLEKGFSNLSYVRPPQIYKDWNKFLKEKDKDVLHSYITKFEKPFNENTSMFILANSI